MNAMNRESCCEETVQPDMEAHPRQIHSGAPPCSVVRGEVGLPLPKKYNHINRCLVVGQTKRVIVCPVYFLSL
jgi:hypothetical protein